MERNQSKRLMRAMPLEPLDTASVYQGRSRRKIPVLTALVTPVFTWASRLVRRRPGGIDHWWRTEAGIAFLEEMERDRRDPHRLTRLVLLRMSEPGPGPRWDVAELSRNGFKVRNAESVLRGLTAEGCIIVGTQPVKGSLGIRELSIKG